jgi:hypothetical protein
MGRLTDPAADVPPPCAAFVLPPSKHVVTLTGTVMGRAGRTKAGEIAKQTEGVHRVVNRLTIGPKRQD